MTPLVSTEESTTTSSMSTKNSETESEEEQKQMVDVEEGTIHDEKTQYSHISVPLPGEQNCNGNFTERTSNANTTETTSLNDIPETRNVPNLCVICHEEYKVADKVCWASSSECTHVFHEECIVRWLTRLGWMKLKEQQELENMNDKDKCLNYDLDCPMCRGKFICKNHLSKNTAVVVAAGTGEESV
mmetsp:Transcript_2529/g.3600  ORF Transcript_2529/g.3600 Transcript_2529/m.3600 type:complete len:187 (+) Transcript_2529:648-1208(+)